MNDPANKDYLAADNWIPLPKIIALFENLKLSSKAKREAIKDQFVNYNYHLIKYVKKASYPTSMPMILASGEGNQANFDYV